MFLNLKSGTNTAASIPRAGRNESFLTDEFILQYNTLRFIMEYISSSEGRETPLKENGSAYQLDKREAGICSLISTRPPEPPTILPGE